MLYKQNLTWIIRPTNLTSYFIEPTSESFTSLTSGKSSPLFCIHFLVSFQNCEFWRFFARNWFYFLSDDAVVSSCRFKTHPPLFSCDKILLWGTMGQHLSIKGWFPFCDFIQQGWYLNTPSLSIRHAVMGNTTILRAHIHTHAQPHCPH